MWRYGKGFARPVDGDAKSACCLVDLRVVIFFPVLAQLHKLRSCKVSPLGLAVDGVFSKLLLNDGLGVDACVVAAGDIQRRELSHSVPSDERVFQRDP